jgi:maleamate amidohydrolase
MSDLDVYEKQNFGNPTGFGRHPALLIVDFVNGFNDADTFGGGNIDAAIKKTRDLLEVFRRLKLPVAMTRVVYADDGSDWGVFCEKAPGLKALTENAPESQIVPELAPTDGEYVVRKTQPSAFFGTNLTGWLTNRGVDTIVHTGCTTSGCVRASVIDGLSYNFRNVVAVDGVGDRALGPHEANLFDMGQKYADLMTCEEIAAAVERIVRGAEAAE